MAKTESTKIVTKKHQARLDRENTQRRYVLLGTIVIAVLVILTIGYGVLDSVYLKEVRPVAKVDGQSITARDFVGQVRYQRYTLVNQVVQLSQFGEYFQQNIQQAKAYLDNPEYLGQQILDRMINDVVIAKEAKARNVSVSDAELEKELESGFSYYPDGTATPTVTPTAFATGTPGPTQMALIPPTTTPGPTNTPTEPAVTSTPTTAPTATVAGPTATIEPTWTPFPTPTEITLDGYKTQYSDYLKQLDTVKISERTLRNLYRADLLQKKMFALITADIAPVQEQVWARHILVATEDEAKAVLDRLNKGEDWNAIAAEVSIDSSNNTTGGDLGWFPRRIMVKEFEDAAFALGVGEISQPVKTDNGFHIIQVIDHQQDRPLTTSIFDQAKQSAWSKWLTDVKATMKVETFDLWKEINPTEPTVPAS